MLRWFTDWLARFVELGIGLAAALIRGVIRGPGAEPLDSSEAEPPPALEEHAQQDRQPEE